MPYIANKNQRENLDNIARQVVAYLNFSEWDTVWGDLNYFVTKLFRLVAAKRFNYCTLNNLTGVLDCVKLEWYRRVVAVYEDGAIARNGDLTDD